jgi:hypothetical protein
MAWCWSGRDLAQGVGFLDELYGRPLAGVGREEDFSKGGSERFDSAREVQPLEELESSVVDPHAVLLIEIDEAGVESPTVGGCEGDSGLDVVNAAGSSHGKDVCSVD